MLSWGGIRCARNPDLYFSGQQNGAAALFGERNIVVSTSQGVYHYCNGTLQTLINYAAAGLCSMRTRLIEGVLDPYLGDDGFQRPLLLNDKIYAFSAGRSHWYAVLDVFSQNGQHLSHKELTDIIDVPYYTQGQLHIPSSLETSIKKCQNGRQSE